MTARFPFPYSTSASQIRDTHTLSIFGVGLAENVSLKAFNYNSSSKSLFKELFGLVFFRLFVSLILLIPITKLMLFGDNFSFYYPQSTFLEKEYQKSAIDTTHKRCF